MTRPGSMQALRIGLARQLHQLPEVIDSMTYEDALRVAMACHLEAEGIRDASQGAGAGKPGGRTKTTRTVYQQRKR